MIIEQEQRTLEWHRARFGCFTGSKIADLMTTSRKKGEIWGATAMSYIYKVAAERDFDPFLLDDDEFFAQFIADNNPTSRAMEWGTEHENEAKECFRSNVCPDAEIVEVGSCKHDKVEGFAASPDGLVYMRDGEEMKVLEIKCPNIDIFMRYRNEIHDAETLKITKPAYYWQMQAEMACTGANGGYFVVYQPCLTHNLHYAEIERNEEDIKAMLERIELANKAIDVMIHT